MAESQGVDVGVRSEIDVAIVQKATNLLCTTKCVDDEHQAVEFVDTVDAVRAHSVSTVLDVPELKIANASVCCRYSELEIHLPVTQAIGVLRPQCAFLVASVRRCEDDFVGKQLRNMSFAKHGPARDRKGVGRYALLVAKGHIIDVLLSTSAHSECQSDTDSKT